MTTQKQKGKTLQIQISSEVADGTYVNFANVIHNASEVIIDFGRIVPGKSDVKIHSRIVTTPHHAKLIGRALAQNLEQYEAKFGPIQVDPTEMTKTVGYS